MRIFLILVTFSSVFALPALADRVPVPIRTSGCVETIQKKIIIPQARVDAAIQTRAVAFVLTHLFKQLSKARQKFYSHIDPPITVNYFTEFLLSDQELEAGLLKLALVDDDVILAALTDPNPSDSIKKILQAPDFIYNPENNKTFIELILTYTTGRMAVVDADGSRHFSRQISEDEKVQLFNTLTLTYGLSAQNLSDATEWVVLSNNRDLMSAVAKYIFEHRRTLLPTILNGELYRENTFISKWSPFGLMTEETKAMTVGTGFMSTMLAGLAFLEPIQAIGNPVLVTAFGITASMATVPTAYATARRIRQNYLAANNQKILAKVLLKLVAGTQSFSKAQSLLYGQQVQQEQKALQSITPVAMLPAPTAEQAVVPYVTPNSLLELKSYTEHGLSPSPSQWGQALDNVLLNKTRYFSSQQETVKFPLDENGIQKISQRQDFNPDDIEALQYNLKDTRSWLEFNRHQAAGILADLQVLVDAADRVKPADASDFLQSHKALLEYYSKQKILVHSFDNLIQIISTAQVQLRSALAQSSHAEIVAVFEKLRESLPPSPTP